MRTEETEIILFQKQDIEYRDFLIKLIPTVSAGCVIGVRTPQLRTLAKQIYQSGDYYDYLNGLPHRFFDENQLHAFIISQIKDFDVCIKEVCRFLPFIDNWATCDQMSPGVFKKHRKELLPYIKNWISSGETYCVRFGIGMLMEHYLDVDFDVSYPEAVAAVNSEEYYVKMMAAWYFATALAKQYDAVVPFIEDGRLDIWTHNKAIQKSVESRRLTAAQKEYLKTLKIKNKALQTS